MLSIRASSPIDAPSTLRDLASVHHRFARAAVWIYAGGACVTAILVAAAMFTDRSHEQWIAGDRLGHETEIRARYFGWYLGLLENELRRLGLRSEVDLLDRNLEPERSLLGLSHNKSTFFNVGVAILDAGGVVLWSEPRAFLAPGTALASEPWFRAVQSSASVRVSAVAPERESDSLVYVVSPVLRGGKFTGALVGAIDLANEAGLGMTPSSDLHVDTVLAMRDGSVVYPPKPPAFASEAGWKSFASRSGHAPVVASLTLDGEAVVAAAAEVRGSDLLFLSLAKGEDLFAPSRRRLRERLALGLVATIVPFLLLLRAFRRSFETFRRSEDEAVREDRLRLVGEAANVIAHEITNSLNGLRVGLEMARDGEAPPARRELTMRALHGEVTRLTDFATELLLFSKGVTPGRVAVDAGELARTVVDLAHDRAADQGTVIDVRVESPSPRVLCDPKLLHVALTNLVGNALDAVAAAGARGPCVSVRVGHSADGVRIRVHDEGAGVPPAIRQRLFEPFVSGKPNGIGIGLALSRKIARAHGGELALVADGPGATLELVLPREGGQ